MQSFEKFFVILGSCEPCSQSRHISCLFYMDFLKEWADTKAHNVMFLEWSPTLDPTSTLMVGRALPWLNWDSLHGSRGSAAPDFAQGLSC